VLFSVIQVTCINLHEERKAVDLVSLIIKCMSASAFLFPFSPLRRQPCPRQSLHICMRKPTRSTTAPRTPGSNARFAPSPVPVTGIDDRYRGRHQHCMCHGSRPQVRRTTRDGELLWRTYIVSSHMAFRNPAARLPFSQKCAARENTCTTTRLLPCPIHGISISVRLTRLGYRDPRFCSSCPSCSPQPRLPFPHASCFSFLSKHGTLATQLTDGKPPKVYRRPLFPPDTEPRRPSRKLTSPRRRLGPRWSCA
jgi:hypothetical protein